MDLRQLEYFQMVSRLNNVTRAAERLHVAQPSITVAIKKLEEELGVQLFDRNQKKITLTSEGKIFLSRVEKILADVQDAVLEMHDYHEIKRGAITVGVPPMIGSFLFPKIFANFRKIYPNIDLTISEEGSLGIREMLEQGDLDLGIIILARESKFLESIPISHNQILACLPHEHRLSLKKSISFSDLKNEKFIMLKEDTYHRQVILEECAKEGFTPEIILSSSQIETIRGLVANGLGISFLIDSIAKRKKDLISIPLSDPIKIQIALAWKKDKYLSKASQAFIEFIKHF